MYLVSSSIPLSILVDLGTLVVFFMLFAWVIRKATPKPCPKDDTDD